MEWKTKKLGDLANINYGYTAKASFEINGPKFLRITDIQDGIVNWSTVPSCELSDQDFIKHKLETNDIVFARTGATTGKSFLIKEIENSVAASYLIRLRLTSSEILPEFVYVFFQTSKYWELVEAGSTGSAQGGFNASKLSNLEINFPSVSEQKRIVGLLDTMFADLKQTRAKTEQNLKNARELFDSYLQQVFTQKGEGWIEAELFDHIKFIDYRGKTPKKTESGLRLITAKNVRMGYLKLNPEEFVAPESYDSWMTRGIPKKGDVLFTSEAPLANVAQLDTDDKVVFAQRIITMQPDRSVINCDFLMYLLMSPPIQERIIEKGTGATVTGIKASLLKKIIIEFPSSIDEQAQCVATLNSLSDSVKQLETIYQQKLDSIDELKKSILQKAFSGELTKAEKQEQPKDILV